MTFARPSFLAVATLVRGVLVGGTSEDGEEGGEVRGQKSEVRGEVRFRDC